MDAIVLAAGRNERLKGYVAPGHKPLMLIDGVPVIVTVVRNLLKQVTRGDNNTLVIVVSPLNAYSIIDVLQHHVSFERIQFLVQPNADGPLDGVVRALVCTQSTSIMIVCADNVIPIELYDELLDVHGGDNELNVVAVRTLSTDEARRFARIDTDGVWREGRITMDDIHENGKCKCWIGPVIVNADTLGKTSAQHTSLARALGACDNYSFIESLVIDIGDPGEVLRG